MWFIITNSLLKIKKQKQTERALVRRLGRYIKVGSVCSLVFHFNFECSISNLHWLISLISIDNFCKLCKEQCIDLYLGCATLMFYLFLCV